MELIDVRKNITKAENEAHSLLWENLEKFLVPYARENERDAKQIRKQYELFYASSVSHFLAINSYSSLPYLKKKPISNFIQAVLHRAGNLRTASLSFANRINPERKKRLSENELCEAENAILAIYVNIFGLFDCWALTLNECLPYEKIPASDRMKIGIQSRKFRSRANIEEIHNMWNSINAWYFDRKDTLRDPFIHRTPPHIVPFVLTEEEGKRFSEIQNSLLPLILEQKFAEVEKLEKERDELGKFSDQLIVGETKEKSLSLIPTVIDDVLRTNYISMQFAKVAIDHIKN